MRNVKLWLASFLMAAITFVGAAVSQPPPPKDVVTRASFPPSRLGVDDMVERIMAFDKNKDGKVTKDELPERMHDLILRGDTNKDGALDRDEIRKLAANPPADPGGPLTTFGFGGGLRVTAPAPGAPGPRPDRAEEVLDDLKLSGKKKDQAMVAAKAHQENVRKLMDQARADLLREMKGILSEVEFSDFRAALDRPGGGPTTINFGGGPPGAPRPKR